MALFRSEPTFTQLLLCYIYNYVILATLFWLAFIYYLIRTRAPWKEERDGEPKKVAYGHAEGRKKCFTNGSVANAIVANGNLEVAEGDQELLQTILHGIELADAAAIEDDVEAGEGHRVARSRKATENEKEEENDDEEPHPRRRQIIREVTVRKIFLPPDARFSDVENAAKRLVGDAQQNESRKDSGAGGTEFRTAIKNIREASKRLEDDDISPVPNDRGYHG